MTGAGPAVESIYGGPRGLPDLYREVRSGWQGMTKMMALIKIRAILPAILITLVFASTATAQRPLERFKQNWDQVRPRGELLKKIFGDNEDEEDDEDSVSSRRVEPTLANPRTALDVQRRQALMAQQERLRQQSLFRQQRMEQSGGDGTSFVPLPPRRNSSPVTGTLSDVTTPANPAPALGTMPLGIQVSPVGDESEPEGLVIDRIEAQGVAARSGLRRGDVIVKIGGIDARYEGDLIGISKVMQPGDQIEFEIRRKGKPRKILVRFGEAAEDTPSPKNSGRIGDITSPAPLNRVASLNNSALKSVLVRD